MTTTLSIPAERHAQLVELRDSVSHATLSVTIRDLIYAFREPHQIPHTIPSLEVRLCRDGLALNYEGQFIEMRTDRALAIAGSLRGYLAEVQTGVFKTIWISGADEYNYLVKSAGRSGVWLLIDDIERVLTHDVASELAAILESTARRACEQRCRIACQHCPDLYITTPREQDHP